ncbi:glycerophosphodiester phosphodiesterase [Angustibacter speluncae]
MVAHRGASHELPEHTEEAYALAIAQGADGLECDVRLTADGHLVCHHDPTLDRTSDGRGRFADRTLADLRRLDWSSPAGGPLTLRRLFELAADAGRRVEVAVETKHPTRYAGEVERQVVDLADWFGWASDAADGTPSPVRVMSFSARAVGRVRAMAPDLTTVLLVDDRPRWAARRPTRLPAGAHVLGPGVHVLREHPDWVRQVREAGHDVHVWTVDRPEDVDLCLEHGVQAIITNRPSEVRGRLTRAREGYPLGRE